MRKQSLHKARSAWLQVKARSKRWRSKTCVEWYYKLGKAFDQLPIWNLFQGRVVVVCYNRVLPARDVLAAPMVNQELSVSFESFVNQLQTILRHYTPIAVDDLLDPNLLERLEEKPGVVFTFDDGYKDNLTCVWPILQQYQVPAAFYITTRFMEGDSSMWWYELWELCERKQSFDFFWDGRFHHFPMHNPVEKLQAFYEIRSWLFGYTPVTLELLFEILRDKEPPANYADTCMTWEDIRRLDQDPLITIGAHTHSHAVLSVLPEEIMQYEMQHCKQLLETHLGHEVAHLAYPFGYGNTVSEREFNFAKELGFKTAMTRHSFPFETNQLLNIPRHIMQDHHDSLKTRTKLSGWNGFWHQQF